MTVSNKSLRDKFDQFLEEENLTAFKEQLYAYLRPCLKLTVSDNKNIALGTSKIGGVPDLPHDLKWPTQNNIPLRFVMQLNLCDLPNNSHLYLKTPEQGHLYFFIANDEPCYDIPNVILCSQEPPKKQDKIDTSPFYEQWDFAENRLEFFEWMSLPCSEELDESTIFTNHELEKILDRNNENCTSQYDKLIDLLANNWENASQLVGWPLEQYNSMRALQTKSIFSYYGKEESEIELLDPPLYPEYDIQTAERMNLKLLVEDYKEQYEKKLQAHLVLKSWFTNVEHLLPQWNLLLALNSHEESNICWWDSSIMNFMVKEDDLKNRQSIKGYAFFEPS